MSRWMQVFFPFICAVLVSLSAPVCAFAQSAELSHYALGPGDKIDIELVGPDGFKLQQEIKADGTIEIPNLGSIPAGDRTTLALGDEIDRTLKTQGLFANPLVTITLVNPIRAVVVLGSVANPGLIPIDRSYRLSEILARVGGVREGGSEYVILRPLNGEQRRIAVQAIATGDASQDPLVSPGDKIFSPKAELFYISGQIKAAGAYPLTPEMTLRMAIARGGGLTDTGSENRVTVTRHNANIDRVDLNSKIESDDVIVVGERFF